MNSMKNIFVLSFVVMGLTACQARSQPVLQETDGGFGARGPGGPGAGGSFVLGGPGGKRGDGGPSGGPGSQGGTGQPGGTGGAGGSGMVAPGCVKTSEVCDGKDNDCDGVADNGYDLKTDVINCGRCGTVCSFPRGTATCEDGTCKLTMCMAGFLDTDGKPENGCECTKSNGSVELCDGADNNCDGKIDEGFDLQTDTKNCGACNKICEFSGAATTCKAGSCAMGACLAGRLDINKDPKDGCEYLCTADGVEVCDGKDNDCNGMIDDAPSDAGKLCGGMVGGVGECGQGMMMCIRGQLLCSGAGSPGREICDGKDNDCDGMTDEEDPLLGAKCFPVGTPGCNVATGACMGPCKLGIWACSVGKLNCAGSVSPTTEICDDKDNDCDGAIDEDFDKKADPRTCGTCAITCKYDNAVPFCRTGSCVRGPCQAGFVDLDGLPANGCEYACVPSGLELCDGKDNDCNGKTDGADPGMVPSPNFCTQVGECGKGTGGTRPVCLAAPGTTTPTWLCNYPATVETLPTDNQSVVADETLCDGKDNDCDGAIDEHVTVPGGAILGTSCADSAGLGECQRKGTWKCAADPKVKTAICDTGGLTVKIPEHEICDGKDNDCDGQIDESWDNPAASALSKCGADECRGIRDDIVQVGSVWVYKYEASRVDADATKQGGADGRSCSRSGVMPWSVVNFVKAQESCRRSGMRLCSATDWTAACKDGRGACSANYFPYDCATFSDSTCNGAERNLAVPERVGNAASCKTPTGGIFDLSGNVAEWTDEQRGTTAGGKRIFAVRGGSISTFQPALTCDNTKLSFSEDYAFIDTGFRCCSSCPAGQAECSGACKNLGTDGQNCGSCGTACPGAQTCKNGKCE